MIANLHQLLAYDPFTGLFTWRVSRGRAKAGAVAGSVRQTGYVEVRVGGTLYLAHRLAWLYMFGKWPDGLVDHINHVKTDNRAANLRDVTPSINQQNRAGLQRNNTSGTTGVHWSAKDQAWVARIVRDGKDTFLHQSAELAAAVAARREAEAALI